MVDEFGVDVADSDGLFAGLGVVEVAEEGLFLGAQASFLLELFELTLDVDDDLELVGREVGGVLVELVLGLQFGKGLGEFS